MLEDTAVVEINSELSNVLEMQKGSTIIVDSNDEDNEEEQFKAANELHPDDSILMKKLATNSAVKNLALMFGKAKTEVTDNKLRSNAKVDMSKFAKPAKADYGLKLKQLRDWKEERSTELARKEESLQEMAIAKVKGFMDAVMVVVKLQAWLRMIKHRRKFKQYMSERLITRRKVFAAWKRHLMGQKMRLNNVVGKPFRAWRGEVEDVKRLQLIVVQFFQSSIKKLKLTPQSVMCFFNRDQFSKALSETDINKVRRLVLLQMFRGWRAQVRALKTNQFKASQMLSRYYNCLAFDFK